MDSYGITSTGFNKKTYDVLITEFEGKLKGEDCYGANIDFSDKDPMKHFSVPIITLLSELWEVAEQCFYSASPKYAEGVPLKSTGKYIGITGKQSSKSAGVERFNGKVGTTIPTAFQVKTETEIVFETIESKSITAEGYVDIGIKALTAGADGDVPANTITKIVSPIIGLTSVTNPSETTGGQDEESDIEFRERYDESTAIRSDTTESAIEANVLKVTDVTDCDVTENYTEAEVDGIPPKSFLTLVKGGDDEAIAKAIFEKKPGGIRPYGTTLVDIVDSKGKTHTIGFSRPTDVYVWIKIDISVTATFPNDGATTIKEAIKDYVDSLDVEENVFLYQLTTVISNLKLNGLEDISIQLSTDGEVYSVSNLLIGSKRLAKTDLNKIEVV